MNEIVCVVDGMQSINFGLLEQKTNSQLVDNIKRTINTVQAWGNKEIRYLVEEDRHEVKVIMCFSGNFVKLTYCKIAKSLCRETMYWVDIRHFFDIPFKMKKFD